VSGEPKGVCRARRLRAALAGALLFVGVVLTMPAQIAGAATQLENRNDSGPGSLRQAVLHVAPGYSMSFAPDLGYSTIILAFPFFGGRVFSQGGSTFAS